MRLIDGGDASGGKRGDLGLFVVGDQHCAIKRNSCGAEHNSIAVTGAEGDS